MTELSHARTVDTGQNAQPGHRHVTNAGAIARALPLVLLPRDTWKIVPFVLTMDGQFIVKDLIVIAGGIVLGIGAIIATYLTGAISDRYSFQPVLIAASLVPLLATLALVVLLRRKV